MKRLNTLIFSTITAGILIGCGGGGGSAGSSTTSTSTPTITPTTATLIDNTISGVKYVNGSAVGFTDANGNFPYTNGLVEFYLGKIKLGELASMTSDKKVFIQDLVGVDRSNTIDSNVLKIASLLQSLDSDLTTDEIEIKLEDFNKFENISDSLDSINVSTVLANNGFTIKSEDKIKEHLVNSQKQHNVIFDNIAPILISSSIINGQTEISKTSSIILTFSEEIPKKYLTTEYFKLTNDLDDSIVNTTIESDGKVITITPNTELSYSQSYEFIISSTLKDFAGNFLSNEGGNNDILIEFLVENELDRTSPVITNFSLLLVDENQTSAFIINATDNSTMTYGISGTDADYFNINSITGEITFKTAPDFETKNFYSIKISATDDSNNITTKDMSIEIKDIYEDIKAPVAMAGDDKKIYYTESISFDASNSTDNSQIVSYQWLENDTILSNEVSFDKSDFSIGTHEITLKVTDDENHVSTDSVNITVFDDFRNILPMSEVGGSKVINSATIGNTTTVTLGSGSQLYFEITNNMERNFVVSEFKIVSSYNGIEITRANSIDSSLLSEGTLSSGETISLGYQLNSSQTANYWVGTYTLTDVNTGQEFTNNFIWNGTIY